MIPPIEPMIKAKKNPIKTRMIEAEAFFRILGNSLENASAMSNGKYEESIARERTCHNTIPKQENQSSIPQHINSKSIHCCLGGLTKPAKDSMKSEAVWMLTRS